MALKSDRSLTPSWDGLAQMRVCFGHQSVGVDIMKALSALTGNHLEVIETNDAEVWQRPVFAHFRVGQNRDPFSKIQAFAQVIDSGVGRRVDAAFFKLCYVDITANTDIDTLFLNYQRTMALLRERYPKVVFLHVTVPLMCVGGGIMDWLREKAGCVNRQQEDQARRHAYNQMLRSAYGSSGRLFDLAEVEATYPDGRPSCFPYHGDLVPTLVPEYTEDGGHLNQRAAEHVAARLLSCLVKTVNEPALLKTSRHAEGRP